MCVRVDFVSNLPQKKNKIKLKKTRKKTDSLYVATELVPERERENGFLPDFQQKKEGFHFIQLFSIHFVCLTIFLFFLQLLFRITLLFHNHRQWSIYLSMYVYVNCCLSLPACITQAAATTTKKF